MNLATPSYGLNLGLEVSQVVTGDEPVTLIEAKNYLKVEYTDDDALIELMIRSAREAVEHYMNLSVVTKTMTAFWTQYQEPEVLPLGPHGDIVSVTKVTKDGDTPLVESTDYTVIGERFKSIATYHTITSCGYHYSGLRVVYETNPDGDNNVKIAILKQLSTDYENRENYNEGGTNLKSEAKRYLKRRVII